MAEQEVTSPFNFPVGGQAPSDEDVPVDSDLNVPLNLPEKNPDKESTPEIEAAKKGHTAMVKAYVEDTSVVEAFVALDDGADLDVLFKGFLSDKGEVDKQQLIHDFINNPGDVTNAKVTQELIAEQDSQSDAKHVVEAAQGPDVDPGVAKLIETQLKLAMDVKRIWDDMSKLDVGLEAASFFIPGGSAKDNFDATGSVFGAEEIIRDLVIGFKHLSAEEQLEVWPSIKGHLLDSMPKIRALTALNAFLDPVGENKLSDFGTFWAVFDVADFALMGFSLAKTISVLGKQLNSIKVLKELSNVDDAVDINTIAVLDRTGEAAKKAGTDVTTTHSNALPFGVHTIDPASVEGMSTASVERMNAIRITQNTVARNVLDEDLVIREDLLSPAEKVLAVERMVGDLADMGFENIKTLSRSDDRTNVTLEFTLKNPDGEDLIDVATFPFMRSDKTSQFVSDPVGVLKRSLTSPTVIMRNDPKDVEAAVRLNSTQDKITNQLIALQAQALIPILGRTGLNTLVPKFVKGSARQKLAELDEVMLLLDNTTAPMTARMLREGVGGIPLDEKQIEAAFNLRGLFDALGIIRNDEKRAEMVADGMREFKTSQGLRVGKPYTSVQAAQGVLNTHKPKSIWIDDTKQLMPTDRLNMGEMYGKGYHLVRLDDAPLEIGKGNPHDLIMMKHWKATDLPPQVLHTKPNYVPRVSTRGYWFVKRQVSATMNGSKSAEGGLKVERYFDNQKDANTFQKTLEAEEPNVTFRVLEDREAEKQAFGSSGLGASGGLYTGARSSEPLKFGLDGTPGERLNTFEALSQNINSVSRFASHNEWRIGMQQKWTNTAKEVGIDVSGGFHNTPLPDTRSGRHLEQMRDQIKDWMGVPSKGERQWEITVQEMAEWAQGAGHKRTGALIHNLTHTDPIASMRAAAFHTLLGWFNPAQFWTQAQGATVSLSLATTRRDPLGGVIAVKNQLALQAASHVESAGALAKIAKAAGLKTDELIEMKTLWKKSGQEDSVISSADHKAALSGSGIGVDALKRSANAGLLFYRPGELINRRTAFVTAFREYKLANEGKAISNEALKGVMARANDFQLNLTKANRAAFQKGILSVGTQFMQVQFKFGETLLGLNGKFSLAERAKIGAGQLALYGTAGIPLANLATDVIGATFGATQADIEKISPEVRKLYNEGFWGFTALSMFGSDVELGQRGAAGAAMEEFVIDMLFSEKSVGEAVQGAFGQVPHRFFNAFRAIKPMFIGTQNDLGWPSKEEFMTAAWEVGKITSTLNNVDKAYMMANWGVVLDNNFMVIANKDFSTGTIIGQALGFEPSVKSKVRDLDTVEREVKELRKKVANMIVGNMWNYAKQAKIFDLSERERNELQTKHTHITKILYQTFKTPRERNLLLAAVKSRIMNPTTKEERLTKQFILDHAGEQSVSLSNIFSSLTTSGLLATGVLDDKE